MTETAIVHVAGIAKGHPRHGGTDKNGEPIYYPQWHFTCSCGERGDDGAAIYAQSTALTHQGGTGATVRTGRGPKLDKDVAFRLPLSCGHVRVDLTDHPGELRRLTRAFCPECWKWADVVAEPEAS